MLDTELATTTFGRTLPEDKTLVLEADSIRVKRRPGSGLILELWSEDEDIFMTKHLSYDSAINLVRDMLLVVRPPETTL